MKRFMLLLCCCIGLSAATAANAQIATNNASPAVDITAIDKDIRCGRYDKVCGDVEGLLAQRGKLSDEEVGQLNQRWQLAAMRAALAVKDPVPRYVALCDLNEHPLFQEDNPRKRLVKQEIDEIKDHYLVRKEQAVIAVYKGLKDKEHRYATMPSRMDSLIDSYANLAKRFPDSPTGQKAAKDAKRLSKQH